MGGWGKEKVGTGQGREEQTGKQQAGKDDAWRGAPARQAQAASTLPERSAMLGSPGRVPWSSSAWRHRPAGLTAVNPTWMPGAKPPSSPTLTESTPYFFFTMAFRWWYTSEPSCGET